MFFGEEVEDGWFDGFQGNLAGDVVDEAVDSGYALVFEEELYGDVFPVFVKEGAYAAFFDENIMA